MTALQAQRVFAKSIVRNGVLDDRDIDMVTEEKKQVIRESEALEFHAVTETPDNLSLVVGIRNQLCVRRCRQRRDDECTK